jgi:hypothetical protein
MNGLRQAKIVNRVQGVIRRKHCRAYRSKDSPMTLKKTTFLALSGTGVFFLGGQSSALTGLLPRLDFTPRSLTLGLQLVVASTELRNRLLSQKLLKCPLLNVLRLVLLELCDEGNRTLKDGALVLFASRDNLR